MTDLKHDLYPVFNVDDVQQAINVWTSELDFTVDRLLRDQETGGIYHAELSLDGLTIMISPMQDNSPIGAGGINFYVYLDSRDIDEYFGQVSAKPGVIVQMAIDDQWWGDRLFAVQDSLGYFWTFARSGGEVNPPSGMVRESGSLTTNEVDTTAPHR